MQPFIRDMSLTIAKIRRKLVADSDPHLLAQLNRVEKEVKKLQWLIDTRDIEKK